MNEDISQRRQEKIDIKVEIATGKDLLALRDLRLLAIQSKDGHVFAATRESVEREMALTEEKWREYFFSNNGFVSVSRYGAEIVGMNLAFEKAPEENLWRMRALYIKPEFRKMGIGVRMFSMGLREIIRLGGKKVSANIEVGNKDSWNLVTKFGFKKVSSGSVELETGETFHYDDVELDDLDDPELIKKIKEVLNAG